MSKHEKLLKQYEGAKIAHVEQDGNFTLVELKYKTHRVFGLAKRNPACDSFIEERGVDIAMARALVKLDKKLNPRKYATKIK